MPVSELNPNYGRGRQAPTIIYVERDNPEPTGAPNLGAAAAGSIIAVAAITAIRNNRVANAETAIQPLRDAVVDFDFDETLNKQLTTSLSGLTWIHLEAGQVVKDTSIRSIERATAASKASAVLLTPVYYVLINNGANLQIGMRATLIAHSVARDTGGSPNLSVSPDQGDGAALYTGHFTYVGNLAGATSDRNHNVALWAADRGAAFRAAVATGDVKLGDWLAADLQRSDSPKAEAGAGKVDGPTGVSAKSTAAN